MRACVRLGAAQHVIDSVLETVPGSFWSFYSGSAGFLQKALGPVHRFTDYLSHVYCKDKLTVSKYDEKFFFV